MIFCFGNSHVGVFSGTNYPVPIWPERSNDLLPWFRTFNMGAVTAYQSMKHIQTIKSILATISEFDKEKDTLLLVFGEVDIRMHVYRQLTLQGRPIESIIEEVAKRYFEAVSVLLTEGFNIALYGCIATCTRATMFLRRPPYGTIEERNEASALFDNLIRVFCKKHNLPYISIFNELLLEDGTSDLRYMDTFYMGEGNGLHIMTNILPLLLWKCRDIGLIPFETIISQYEK